METKANNTPQEIHDVIDVASRILLISHRKPDGDTLGANLGLYHYIKNLPDKEIVVFCVDTPASVFSFMPGIGIVSNNKQLLQRNFDCICIFDAGDLLMTMISDELLEQQKQGSVIIDFDHHVTNTRFGDFNFVLTDAASSTEVVYRFIRSNGGMINQASATCLLTGLVTDTGFFSNGATKSTSLELARVLVLAGADFPRIQERFLKDKNMFGLRLWGEALNRLSYNTELGIAWTYIRKEELASIPGGSETVEGLSNFLDTVLNVPVILVLKEKEDGVSGSLRSCAEIDVSALAMQFGGGGHKRAAGFFVEGAALEVDANGCHII